MGVASKRQNEVTLSVQIPARSRSFFFCFLLIRLFGLFWAGLEMELGHAVLMMVLGCLLMQVTSADPQRVSIVERLKALDKGIRQGLQRQKSTDANAGSVTQPQVYPATEQEKAAATSHQLQQQALSPEDTDGTSDVVRQLTASYEDDDDVSSKTAKYDASMTCHVQRHQT